MDQLFSPWIQLDINDNRACKGPGLAVFPVSMQNVKIKDTDCFKVLWAPRIAYFIDDYIADFWQKSRVIPFLTNDLSNLKREKIDL